MPEPKRLWRFARSRPKTSRENLKTRLETAVDVQEVRKLDAYLKRVFGNPKIRVVPRPMMAAGLMSVWNTAEDRLCR